MRIFGPAGLVVFLACWGTSHLCGHSLGMFRLNHPSAWSFYVAPGPNGSRSYGCADPWRSRLD